MQTEVGLLSRGTLFKYNGFTYKVGETYSTGDNSRNKPGDRSWNKVAGISQGNHVNRNFDSDTLVEVAPVSVFESAFMENRSLHEVDASKVGPKDIFKFGGKHGVYLQTLPNGERLYLIGNIISLPQGTEVLAVSEKKK